ncbi:MAG: acyl-CoA desaturase [Anaerolineae bacterium]|nr:acyl-CoA desaturase [Anaerolineae bacterium]
MTTIAPALGKAPARSIQFTGQRGFRKTLNERVEAHLRENGVPARDLPAMYAKTAISLVWWLGAYLLILLGGFPTWVNLILCVVFAFAVASIGFNVMHDANHRGYSDNPRVNRIVSLSAELAGISGFRWRTKHNVWHHTYTNIAGYDDDIEAYGLIRLSPRVPWRPLHRFQAWYFPLVYSLIAFDFILRDFLMALFGRSDPNHVYPKMTAGDKVTFWLGKLVYAVLMFAIPMLVFPWWQVLIGYVLIMLVLGLLLGVVFQLAHISGDANFPEPKPNPLRIDNEWGIHQVETTVDFAPRNKLLNFYIGGLNYQIEHHLLPHVCHLNYPRLAPIVEQTCAEYGLRYVAYPTWRAAFMAHWRQLRALGQPSG